MRRSVHNRPACCVRRDIYLLVRVTKCQKTHLSESFAYRRRSRSLSTAHQSHKYHRIITGAVFPTCFYTPVLILSLWVTAGRRGWNPHAEHARAASIRCFSAYNTSACTSMSMGTSRHTYTSASISSRLSASTSMSASASTSRRISTSARISASINTNTIMSTSGT